MNNVSPKAISNPEPFEDRIDFLFKELELAIRWQRPSILLAIYNSGYVCADAAVALENMLTDLGQKTAHYHIRDEQSADLMSYIANAPETETTVFFVDGLRWGGHATYRTLNLSREHFVNQRIRIVLWLTENEAADLAHYAPDYWAYRHRVIEFIESPKPEQILLHALESEWQVVGEFTNTLEDTDEKIALRNAMLTDLPESAESLGIRSNLMLTLGILHWRKGNFEKALEMLQASLSISINIEEDWLQAACLNAIALVQTDLGRFDDAIEAYQQAINLTPDQIFPWNNLGNLYNKLERNEEALRAYEKAVQHNREDAVAWNGLGNTYARLGRTLEAIDSFKKAIELSPRFAYPWNGLGGVYVSINETDKAVEVYQRAAVLNPQFVSPWVSLGRIYHQRGENQEALSAYWAALRIDPRNAQLWNTIGNVYFFVGSYEEAILSYNKAIDLDRDFECSYSNLALAYARIGKLEESVKCYQRSVELLNKNATQKDKQENEHLYQQLADVETIEAPLDVPTIAPAVEAPIETATVEIPVDAPSEVPAEMTASSVEESAPVAEAEQVMDVELVADVEPVVAEPVAAAAVETEPQPEAVSSTVAIEIIVENAVDAEPGLTPDIQEALQEIFGDQIAAENASAAAVVESTEVVAETPAAPEVVTEPVAVEEAPQAEVVVVEAVTEIPVAQEVAEAPQVEISAVETAAETAVAVPTRDAQAWNELGNVHLASGAYDEAISAYIKAIETDDKFGVAYNNLALAYTIAGKSAEAVLLYQKMIDILSRPDADVVWELPHKALAETKPVPEQLDESWPVYGLHEISIDAIYPNPRQPRMDIDVEELTASIRAHGFIQPLVVSPNGTRGKYVLIAGHRRLEAARQAGFGKVPVIVRAANEQQHLELALVENAQRVDLNPLELAEAYRQLSEEFEMTHEDIALRVGKSRASVSNTLRLLKLSDKVKMALMEERITEGHARALISLTTPQAQNVALQHLLANSLSVRQTEEWVRKALGEKTMYPPEDAEPETAGRDAEKEEDKLSSASLLKRARSLLLSNRSAEQPTFSYRHAS